MVFECIFWNNIILFIIIDWLTMMQIMPIWKRLSNQKRNLLMKQNIILHRRMNFIENKRLNGKIINLEKVSGIIKNEKIDVLVISYGGSCSNEFIHVLEKNNYVCKIPIWVKILCHCPEYIDVNIPIIYIYDSPIKSFLSMKKRGPGYWDTNQKKLSNNENIELSDENLLKLMIKQFKSWTNVKKDNILILKTSEIFEENIVNKLSAFLQKTVLHFPIAYKTPKTNIETDIDSTLSKLFEKYKNEIDEITNYTTTI